MTTPAPLEQLGRLLALVLSGIVISVIAFFVLDEANARFGVMAASVVIVALTSPLARGRLGRWGQLLDVILIAGFAYSAVWFFQVKSELYTGFFRETTQNLIGGLINY